MGGVGDHGVESVLGGKKELEIEVGRDVGEEELVGDGQGGGVDSQDVAFAEGEEEMGGVEDLEGSDGVGGDEALGEEGEVEGVAK